MFLSHRRDPFDSEATLEPMRVRLKNYFDRFPGANKAFASSSEDQGANAADDKAWLHCKFGCV